MDILMMNKHEMIPTTDEHGQVRKVRGIFFNHGQARIDTETRCIILGSVRFRDFQWLIYNHKRMFIRGKGINHRWARTGTETLEI